MADTGKIIKVIGVGGGGGNAVKHMYGEGIHDVSFVLCNTDSQHMADSDVPVKIVLGPNTTKGLGAGNNPEKAREAALESEQEIRTMLNDGTRMVFITATMGGGTGTGAAPVIAGMAREMNILTVGIVTIPFLFEGYDKIIQALDGVKEMSQNVDSLLVVNNERLSELYREKLHNKTRVSLREAFAKANDTLTVAAKSISELITLPGEINLDFADVNTTLKDGGIALMSAGYGEGPDRLETAIREALNSPLLSYNDFDNAKKILFQVTTTSDKQFELGLEEMAHLYKFMKEFSKYNIKVIWGTAYDDALGEKVKFMILASGFGLNDILTGEEQEALSKEKESERKKEEENMRKRIEHFYGTQDRSNDLMERIAVLSGEEMDNDSFILWLEEHPVCDRKPEELAAARRKNAPDIAPSLPASTPGADKAFSIKFN
jgi:cell division protein FtsZ